MGGSEVKRGSVFRTVMTASWWSQMQSVWAPGLTEILSRHFSGRLFPCNRGVSSSVLPYLLDFCFSSTLRTKDSNRSPAVVSGSGFQRRPLVHELNTVLTITSCSWLPRFFPHLADRYIVANKSGTVDLYVAYKLERGTDNKYLMIYCVIFLWGREHKPCWGKGWGSLNELRRDADADRCVRTS